MRECVPLPGASPPEPLELVPLPAASKQTDAAPLTASCSPESRVAAPLPWLGCSAPMSCGFIEWLLLWQVLFGYDCWWFHLWAGWGLDSW